MAVFVQSIIRFINYYINNSNQRSIAQRPSVLTHQFSSNRHAVVAAVNLLWLCSHLTTVNSLI